MSVTICHWALKALLQRSAPASFRERIKALCPGLPLTEFGGVLRFASGLERSAPDCRGLVLGAFCRGLTQTVPDLFPLCSVTRLPRTAPNSFPRNGQGLDSGQLPRAPFQRDCPGLPRTPCHLLPPLVIAAICPGLPRICSGGNIPGLPQIRFGSLLQPSAPDCPGFVFGIGSAAGLLHLHTTARSPHCKEHVPGG